MVYISSKVNEAIDFVHTYAGHVDDWIVIKKEILKTLPSEDRSLFSLRHPITKKQRTNDFERIVMRRWEELTGRTILFTEEHVDE